jgi:hypothetical protein
VSCDAATLGEDATLAGSYFNVVASMRGFYGNWRRLVGYGAPVVIFFVRSFNGEHIGCSLGPLTDYVTVGHGNDRSTTHELGHACNLWHIDTDGNLMKPGTSGTSMKWWQIAILRDSRHVTYF